MALDASLTFSALLLIKMPDQIQIHCEIVEYVLTNIGLTALVERMLGVARFYSSSKLHFSCLMAL